MNVRVYNIKERLISIDPNPHIVPVLLFSCFIFTVGESCCSLDDFGGDLDDEEMLLILCGFRTNSGENPPITMDDIIRLIDKTLAVQGICCLGESVPICDTQQNEYSHRLADSELCSAEVDYKVKLDKMDSGIGLDSDVGEDNEFCDMNDSDADSGLDSSWPEPDETEGQGSKTGKRSSTVGVKGLARGGRIPIGVPPVPLYEICSIK